ncbi:hypothetical protein Tco_1223284 [Tanacetum coccineum]
MADHKVAKDKSKEALRRMTPAQRKAHEQKLTKIESKRTQQLNKSREEILKLKMLVFTEWLEFHELASKKKDHERPPAEQKRKRTNEILKEVFVIEDVLVDGMHRNLNPLQGITSGKSGQVHNVINVDSEYAQKVLDELMLLIEFRLVVAAKEIVEKNLDGL